MKNWTFPLSVLVSHCVWCKDWTCDIATYFEFCHQFQRTNQHLNFVETVLPYFSISQHQISVDFNKNRSLKHDRIFQKQQVNGYDVLFSQLQTKWKEGKLVLWALDWWADAYVPEGEILSDEVILQHAIAEFRSERDRHAPEGYQAQFTCLLSWPFCPLGQALAGSRVRGWTPLSFFSRLV